MSGTISATLLPLSLRTAVLFGKARLPDCPRRYPVYTSITRTPMISAMEEPIESRDRNLMRWESVLRMNSSRLFDSPPCWSWNLGGLEGYLDDGFSSIS